MATFFAQKYRDLYKVHNVADSTGRQQGERRLQMLKAQKKQRDEAVDEARGLVQAIENYSLPNYQSNRLPYRVDVFYRNKVQLSEWLRDRPDDLDNWILVPCPKGKRHIVVAAANKTIAYSKGGTVIDIFQSSLQSGRYLTVLDCIFSEETQSFYVLDVLIYHNQEFLLCEASFRFYWVRSKFDEFDHSLVHSGNQYAFHHIDRAEFDHPEEVEGMLSRYPLWEDNKPALDGFLLYHKLAHYTHGKTPLVGWLLPWMIPEMLGYAVNPEYVKQKPSGSVSALEFMTDFDEQREQRNVGQQKRRNFFNPKKKRNGNAGLCEMDVQQEDVQILHPQAECSWSENTQNGGGGLKMEVLELTATASDLDELEQEEEYADGGIEELLHQRGFDELPDERDDVDETTAIELQDNDRQPMTKRHKNNINRSSQQQVVGGSGSGDQKRISSVFKF